MSDHTCPTIHACPPGDSGVTPCCGRTPFELPMSDRMATDPTLVSCGGSGLDPAACTCTPCKSPAYGAPGVAHCMACCAGSLIEEYDHNCPLPEHQRTAELQHPVAAFLAYGKEKG